MLCNLQQPWPFIAQPISRSKTCKNQLGVSSHTIVAADHRNRYKSFSILLQGVVDAKCSFTSINTNGQGEPTVNYR